MYSQAGQDDFVLSLIPSGKYLEIGASHPIAINNTYLLEQHGWEGLSIDIDASNQSEWNRVRKNRLMICDALAYPYALHGNVDYLQIDIEPSDQSLRCLIKILTAGLKFKVLTFEHDHYAGGDVREVSRELLTNAGYHLSHPDVSTGGLIFEDWWIDETLKNKL